MSNPTSIPYGTAEEKEALPENLVPIQYHIPPAFCLFGGSTGV